MVSLALVGCASGVGRAEPSCELQAAAPVEARELEVRLALDGEWRTIGHVVLEVRDIVHGACHVRGLSGRIASGDREVSLQLLSLDPLAPGAFALEPRPCAGQSWTSGISVTQRRADGSVVQLGSTSRGAPVELREVRAIAGADEVAIHVVATDLALRVSEADGVRSADIVERLSLELRAIVPVRRDIWPSEE